MSVTLLKFDDQTGDIVPVTVNDVLEAGQLILDGVGGVALNASMQLINNVGQPQSDYDATNKQYVDTQVAAYVSGGTGGGAQGPAGSQIYAGNGAPSDTLGIQGDYYVQRDGALLWGPKSASTWGSTILRLQGPAGASGGRGPIGLSGPGVRQSFSDPPSPNLGSDGDYALCTTGNLYGPRASGVYPTQPLNLVGAKGDPGPASVGATGAGTLFSTTTPPDVSLGQIADLCITQSGFLFGPKNSNGWGTAVASFIGPKGDKGDPSTVPGPGVKPATSEPPAQSFANDGDFALVNGHLYGPKSGTWPSSYVNLIGAKGDSVQGVPGVRGASVQYSAVTPPSASLGQDGDLALCQSGALFGPKQSGAWGSQQASLLGPAGKDSVTPGPQGNGIRTSQSDPPPSSLGIDGDYALSPLNRLYGPRANGAWPSTYINVVGPKGDSVKGDMGSVGQRGASVLYSQNDPPSNALGLDNDLAITYDGLLYGPKASGAWGASQASLVGPPARDGQDGQVGPRGASVLQAQADPPDNGLGLTGDYAISPSSVLYGPKPSSGQWPSGGVLLVGPRGAASTQPGPMGYSLISGNGAPSTQGNVGDTYLDVQNGNLYPAKTSSGWGSNYLSLIGPRGPVGSQGSRGPGVFKTSVYSSQDNLPTAGYINSDSLITSDNFLFTPFSVSNGWPAVGFSLTGPRGLSGAAGATIRVSSSTPDPNLGNVGDFVFEQDNTSFIGPKTSSGWPSSGTSLKGAPGQSITGPRGASVLQADANPPSSGLGNVGDFSLTADGYLYGPKQSSGWPSSSLYLVGARGAASTTPGPQGASIDSGSGPPTSQIGRDGDAAYVDITNGNLYGARANGAWPSSFTSLVGPQGKTIRGSQIYNGTGPPSSDLTTYSPNGPAQPGDLYLATDTQYLYVLGS